MKKAAFVFFGTLLVVANVIAIPILTFDGVKWVFAKFGDPDAFGSSNELHWRFGNGFIILAYIFMALALVFGIGFAVSKAYDRLIERRGAHN